MPLLWLIGTTSVLGSAIIGSFLWWIRGEFQRVSAQHERLSEDLRRIHLRVDHLIGMITRIESRDDALVGPPAAPRRSVN